VGLLQSIPSRFEIILDSRDKVLGFGTGEKVLTCIATKSLLIKRPRHYYRQQITRMDPHYQG
jgi:hypothetical protein